MLILFNFVNINSSLNTNVILDRMFTLNEKLVNSDPVPSIHKQIISLCVSGTTTDVIYNEFLPSGAEICWAQLHQKLSPNLSPKISSICEDGRTHRKIHAWNSSTFTIVVSNYTVYFTGHPSVSQFWSRIITWGIENFEMQKISKTSILCLSFQTQN